MAPIWPRYFEDCDCVSAHVLSIVALLRTSCSIALYALWSPLIKLKHMSALLHVWSDSFRCRCLRRINRLEHV